MKRLSYALLIGIFAMSEAGAAQASQDPNYQAPSKIDPVVFDSGMKEVAKILGKRAKTATQVFLILEEMDRLKLGISNGESEESKCQQLKEFFEANNISKEAIIESLNEYFVPKGTTKDGKLIYRNISVDQKVVLETERQFSDAAQQLAE